MDKATQIAVDLIITGIFAAIAMAGMYGIKLYFKWALAITA